MSYQVKAQISNRVTPPIRSHVRQSHIAVKYAGRFLLHIGLLFFGLLMAGPFLWMMSSVFKENSKLFLMPPQFIPHPFVFDNIVNAWAQINFVAGYKNSFIIAVLVVVLQLLTVSMAAFSFARLNFAFKNFIFMLFMATMMIPGQVTIIPKFIMFKYFGWIDSYMALIIPPALSAAFGVFLMRQHILGIPQELDESAYMDGARKWTIYWRIILPLCAPALSALAIFTFLWSWNDLFHPLIYLKSELKYTLPLQIAMSRNMYTADFSVLLSGAAISIFPIIILYIFCQRYIVEGITMTGLKA
jgi:multiple sugar transport system permease protein